MNYIFPFITALFITMVMIPPLVRASSRLKLIDVPNERKVHQGVIPRSGGIAMIIGVAVAVLFWSEIDRFVASYLLGVVVISVFGAIDDRFDLDYKLKLLGQFLAVLLPVTYGGLTVSYFPFLPLGFELPALLAVPFTILILLGITNAINLSDGLDGLAGGTSLLALGLIAVLSYMADGHALFLICLCTIGCVLGFLRFNTHPAQIFMGDTGSQFLGFSSGVLVIHVSQNVNAALSPALPLLILGLPVLDMLSVMAQRIKTGRSPFKPDKNHLHHRLLGLGFDHREAVFIIYIIQSVFISSAYLLRYSSDLIIAVMYIAFSASILFLISIAEKKSWQAHRKNTRSGSYLLSEYIKWMRDRNRLSTASFYVVALLLVLYVSLGAFYSKPMQTDIGLLALSLLAICGGGSLLLNVFKMDYRWLERACLYISGSVFIYLIEGTQEISATINAILNGILILMAVAVAINTRYAKEGGFEVTTLDYLVVFVALMLPQLSITSILGLELGVLIAKLIVWFYGIELLVGYFSSKPGVSRLVFYYVLMLMAVKGFAAI